MSEHILKTPDPISLKFSQFCHDTSLRNVFAGFYDKSIPSQVASEYTDILMSEHISKTPDPISMKFSQFGHDTSLRNEFAWFYDKCIPSQVTSEYLYIQSSYLDTWLVYNITQKNTHSICFKFSHNFYNPKSSAGIENWIDWSKGLGFIRD